MKQCYCSASNASLHLSLRVKRSNLAVKDEIATPDKAGLAMTSYF